MFSSTAMSKQCSDTLMDKLKKDLSDFEQRVQLKQHFTNNYVNVFVYIEMTDKNRHSRGLLAKRVAEFNKHNNGVM